MSRTTRSGFFNTKILCLTGELKSNTTRVLVCRSAMRRSLILAISEAEKLEALSSNKRHKEIAADQLNTLKREAITSCEPCDNWLVDDERCCTRGRSPKQQETGLKV
jgi:hypothetical protein